MNAGDRANLECAVGAQAVLWRAEPEAVLLFPYGLQCCLLNRGGGHFCGALHFPHNLPCPNTSSGSREIVPAQVYKSEQVGSLEGTP